MEQNNNFSSTISFFHKLTVINLILTCLPIHCCFGWSKFVANFSLGYLFYNPSVTSVICTKFSANFTSNSKLHFKALLIIFCSSKKKKYWMQEKSETIKVEKEVFFFYSKNLMKNTLRVIKILCNMHNRTEREKSINVCCVWIITKVIIFLLFFLWNSSQTLWTGSSPSK